MALNISFTKERHTGRWVFFIVLIALLAASGWYGYRWYMTGEVPPILFPIVSADTAINEVAIKPSEIDAYTVPASNPRYISIPSLSIGKTRVFPVTVDAHNQLGTTNNINDVAWYSKSATPGSGGVILIDGHSGGNSRDGVFAQLGTVKIGSEIIIERGDGNLFTYKVAENQSMSLDEVNATGMKMMGRSAGADKEGLNLITCDGKYVPRLKQFDRRIMLRAVLVD